MKNQELAHDYITRAGHRLAAVELLLQRKSFADVVRESQEIVELCLKAVLRKSGIESPRVHDVSEILEQEKTSLIPALQPHLKKLTQISRNLRRDRELAFYGSEDLTPSRFYHQEEAEQALKDAHWVHEICSKTLQF